MSASFFSVQIFYDIYDRKEGFQMTNIISVIVIALVLVLAGRHTVRHFKGRSGCCGGGDYKPRKKKLKHVHYRKTFRVEGMHCEHCKNRVEEIINDIPGTAGQVNLKKGELTVLYAEEVDDGLLAERLRRAGYTLAGIVGSDDT